MVLSMHMKITPLMLEHSLMRQDQNILITDLLRIDESDKWKKILLPNFPTIY